MIETCTCCGFYKMKRNDCSYCRLFNQRSA